MTGIPSEYSQTCLPNPFEIIDTSTWEVSSIEPSGAEIKYVLIDPKNPDVRWFFKNNSIDKQLRYGEDFAEVIASHLAPIFGVSSAQVFFATHRDVEGIISRNVAPRGLELVHGSVWLPAHGCEEFLPHQKYRVGHSLKNIQIALSGLAAPPDAIYPDELTAFDAFAGMCLFDTWIANQDRHEENWAVLKPMIQREDLVESLSPIYDNGSSLAFNLDDAKMAEMLNDSNNPRIEQWCRRARANRFEYVQPENRSLKLLDLAVEALSMCSEAGQHHWRQQLSNIDLKQARGIAHEIDKMSDIRRRFIGEVLTVNMERIQNVCLDSE